MYTDMEMWTEVRRRVLSGGISKRAACREYGIHWDTLRKILRHVEPPGYQHQEPRRKPKIGPFLPIIHAILEADKRAPRKPRHTAKRIWQRLAFEDRLIARHPRHWGRERYIFDPVHYLALLERKSGRR